MSFNKFAKINDYYLRPAAFIFAKIFLMKKFVAVVLLLAAAGFAAWFFIFKKETKKGDDPKPVGLTVSQHSEGFNQTMTKALDAYYTLTESFVNWDTAKVSASITALKEAVDSLGLKEMEKDTAIYPTVQSSWENIKSEIAGMQADTSLYEKKESLNSLSQQFFDLLRIVKYDAVKVYYHECPMALNNYESSAFWLSTTGDNKSRRNPYLGLFDPEYGKAMLTCGATRDSINFATGQTVK
jgi:flagellar basal body-associated protein FliL